MTGQEAGDGGEQSFTPQGLDKSFLDIANLPLLSETIHAQPLYLTLFSPNHLAACGSVLTVALLESSYFTGPRIEQTGSPPQAPPVSRSTGHVGLPGFAEGRGSCKQN